MRKPTQSLVVVLMIFQTVGCSMLPVGELAPSRLLDAKLEHPWKGSGSGDKSSGEKIANPPAKTLRFDGHEIVLGQAESSSIDPVKLESKLRSLIERRKWTTASKMIHRHRESAERFLADCWATQPEDVVVELVAQELSRHCTNKDTSWTGLLSVAKSRPSLADEYQEPRNAFAHEMCESDPSDNSAEHLLRASVQVSHPLARVDALRLVGLRDLVAGRYVWAETHFRQAIDIATSSGNPRSAAELWLTVAESARRNNQTTTAKNAWANGTQLYLSACQADLPLDVSFWLLADKTRPESAKWPTELSTYCAGYIHELGCTPSTNIEFMFWSAVAQAQFERGESQTALVNFKRAETHSQGANAMWLRIAQARCLAAIGQAPAASAILSIPAASADSAVAAAATATMGSIKLQSGAYQQGAQLLHKALTQSTRSDWPFRNQSLADLAIAQLIIGDTDSGLKALHSSQTLLENSGKTELLIQSLENELRLLEFENRHEQHQQLQARIAQLEDSRVSRAN